MKETDKISIDITKEYFQHYWKKLKEKQHRPYQNYTFFTKNHQPCMMNSVNHTQF